MEAIRYEVRDTNTNLQAILSIIDSNCTKRVILFASPTKETQEMSHSDGPDPRLPLLSALAEYEIPHIATIYIVFDGLFLTAALRPRYPDIKKLLDIAQESGKVFFAKERAPFTSALTPANAVEELLKIKNIAKLNKESRASFFSLLSAIPEESIV